MASKKDLSWLPEEIRPRSVGDQWTAVQEWYEFLESNKGDESWVDGYNEAWESIAPLYEYKGKSCVDRGAECRSAETPLATLFYFVEMGFYPPPELLLALSDAWKSYEQCSGYVSLEEAFLGPTKKKAGNYARRHCGRMVKLRMAWQMTTLVRQGLTRIAAAERIAKDWERDGFHYEPETIVRTIKTFAFGKPEVPKASVRKIKPVVARKPEK